MTSSDQQEASQESNLIFKNLNNFLNPTDKLKVEYNPVQEFMNEYRNSNKESRDEGYINLKKYLLTKQNKVNYNCRSCIRRFEDMINNLQVAQGRSKISQRLNFFAPDNFTATNNHQFEVKHHSHGNYLTQTQSSGMLSMRKTCHFNKFIKTQTNFKKDAMYRSNSMDVIKRQDIDIETKRGFKKWLNVEHPTDKLCKQTNVAKGRQNYHNNLVQRQWDRNEGGSQLVGDKFQKIMQKFY